MSAEICSGGDDDERGWKKEGNNRQLGHQDGDTRQNDAGQQRCPNLAPAEYTVIDSRSKCKRDCNGKQVM